MTTRRLALGPKPSQVGAKRKDGPPPPRAAQLRCASTARGAAGERSETGWGHPYPSTLTPSVSSIPSGYGANTGTRAHQIVSS
jgi:hypothetical protein